MFLELVECFHLSFFSFCSYFQFFDHIFNFCDLSFSFFHDVCFLSLFLISSVLFLHLLFIVFLIFMLKDAKNPKLDCSLRERVYHLTELQTGLDFFFWGERGRGGQARLLDEMCPILSFRNSSLIFPNCVVFYL